MKRGETPSQEELEALMAARHTPGVHEVLKRSCVGIAGLGGLGSNIAVSLARVGIGKLILVDFDVVEQAISIDSNISSIKLVSLKLRPCDRPCNRLILFLTMNVSKPGSQKRISPTCLEQWMWWLKPLTRLRPKRCLSSMFISNYLRRRLCAAAGWPVTGIMPACILAKSGISIFAAMRQPKPNPVRGLWRRESGLLPICRLTR